MGRCEVRVECYSGARSDERPRRVYVNDRQHIVARLLSSSMEEAAGSRKQARRFRILTEEGLVLDLVRYDDGRWYIESERVNH
jgi:hypothetical protein